MCGSFMVDGVSGGGRLRPRRPGACQRVGGLAARKRSAGVMTPTMVWPLTMGSQSVFLSSIMSTMWVMSAPWGHGFDRGDHEGRGRGRVRRAEVLAAVERSVAVTMPIRLPLSSVTGAAA